MTEDITRSAGTEIPGSGGLVAGGGMHGITQPLDAAVQRAAVLLGQAYACPVVIRFNSDRESGGAWLRTADGSDAWVGICASLVTARARAQWLAYAERDEAMARTGVCSWGGPATARQRQGAAECAADWRRMLAEHPEGQLTVLAHVEYVACRPELRRELAQLDGWNAMEHRPDHAYHHGETADVAAALDRVLRFAPPSRITELTGIIEAGRAEA